MELTTAKKSAWCANCGKSILRGAKVGKLDARRVVCKACAEGKGEGE